MNTPHIHRKKANTMDCNTPYGNALQAGVSPETIRYVEERILPLYAAFDKAHRQDHARMVISQSLDLAAHFPDINIDMVYLVAAFHDLGLAYGRENHHRHSRSILEADGYISTHFTAEETTLMGEAVEDHRASGTMRPRNTYGLIVAEADRCIDATTIIRRTIQYGLAHYPELDRQSHYKRATQHLTEKYGPDGYLTVWLPWSTNAAKLKELRTLLADKTAMNALFTCIFKEETERK